jgi:hypothetical protein
MAGRNHEGRQAEIHRVLPLRRARPYSPDGDRRSVARKIREARLMSPSVADLVEVFDPPPEAVMNYGIIGGRGIIRPCSEGGVSVVTSAAPSLPPSSGWLRNSNAIGCEFVLPWPLRDQDIGRIKAAVRLGQLPQMRTDRQF